jgi:hypothetical protein
MLWSAGVWFAAHAVLRRDDQPAARHRLLFVAGFMQSFCLTPLAAIMLRTPTSRCAAR